MPNYGLPSLSGVVITYSSKYYSFSFENCKILDIVNPLKKSQLISTEVNDDDSPAIEFVSEGKNKPTIITISVECKSNKMGEISTRFNENAANYDTAGTLEILESDGSLHTYNSAVLNGDPVARNIDSVSDTITYELIFHTKPVIFG